MPIMPNGFNGVTGLNAPQMSGGGMMGGLAPRPMSGIGGSPMMGGGGLAGELMRGGIPAGAAPGGAGAAMNQREMRMNQRRF